MHTHIYSHGFTSNHSIVLSVFLFIYLYHKRNSSQWNSYFKVVVSLFVCSSASWSPWLCLIFRRVLFVSTKPPTRVPLFPIRDFAGSCNSCAQMCHMSSTTNVTAVTFFERLYLVPGLRKFVPWINCPCAPTPPPFTEQLLLDFRTNFPPSGPSFFWSARFTK